MRHTHLVWSHLLCSAGPSKLDTHIHTHIEKRGECIIAHVG